MNIIPMNNVYNMHLRCNNAISFGTSEKSSFEKAQFYIETLQNFSKYSSKKYTKQDIEEFFEELNKENSEVQKLFISTKVPELDCRTFYFFACHQPDFAPKVFNIVKNLDSESKARFFITSPSFSPLYMAIVETQNEKLADEMLDMIQSFDKDVQKIIFSQRDYQSKKTLDEILLDKGYINFFRKVKKLRETLDDKQTADTDFLAPLGINTPSHYKVIENVKTKFKDVGGLFNVKNQIQNELLSILTNPDVKNSDKPGGILLYGPPGTGKTLLATAIAGEAKVPFISTNGANFVELFVGSGPKHVRELYSHAKKLAKNHPSKTAIVFIDEADAIAAKRGQFSSREGDNTLNSLLSELDGVESKEKNDIKVITILATNRRDMLDEAVRKGRIDLEFKIDDPRYSEKARRDILEIQARNRKFKSDEEKNNILDELAKTSSGLSGAELADIIKRAYRRTLYLGRNTPYITEKDILEAKLETIIGAKNDTEESQNEIRAVLAHEAGHAINLLVMTKIFEKEQGTPKAPNFKLDYIINESRGNTAGTTLMKPSGNSRLTVESLLSELVVAYGGYSIEESMFDGHSDGVSGDLTACTRRIIEAVTKYGLGSKTKYISCSDEYAGKLFAHDIKKDIIKYSSKGMEISSEISAFVKPFIEDYIQQYSDNKDNRAKIISGDEFEKMFNKWLNENGNMQEYLNLCEKIRSKVHTFKQEIK